MNIKGNRNREQPQNSNGQKTNSIEQPNQHNRKDDREGINKEDAGGTGLGHRTGQGKDDNQIKKQ